MHKLLMQFLSQASSTQQLNDLYGEVCTSKSRGTLVLVICWNPHPYMGSYDPLVDKCVDDCEDIRS